MRGGRLVLTALALTVFVLGTACGEAPGERPVDQAEQTTIRAEPSSQSGRTIGADIPEPTTITAQELKELLDAPNKPIILDVRLKASYDVGHIPGAISLPLDELDARALEVPQSKLLICYCSGGP